MSEELIDCQRLTTTHLLATLFERTKLALRRGVDRHPGDPSRVLGIEVEEKRLTNELGSATVLGLSDVVDFLQEFGW